MSLRAGVESGTIGEHGRTRAHVYVSGHVQGAYYRATTCDTARDRGVGDWMKNLSDDRIEVIFEGFRDGVEVTAEWYHKGGLMATVEGADITFEEPDSETRFRIEY